MDATIVAGVITALIVAFASLGATVFEVTRRHRYQQQRAEQAARREYEYKALQRLYEEYEPLRFQLVEAVAGAKRQIEELGKLDALRRQGKAGVLPGGNYLLLATIYNLLLPLAVHRIARRRLTLIDFTLDPQIAMQYLLSKEAYLALTHDGLIADMCGLDYTPYVDGWREKREAEPAKYRRQGLPLGRLDNAVDTLIAPLSPSSHSERLVTFGEFEARFADVPEEDARSGLGAARDLFFDFHPAHRPVLWRVLLAQFFLYKAILRTVQEGYFDRGWLEGAQALLTSEERNHLRWREAAAETAASPALEAALEGAEKYLREAVVPDLQQVESKYGQGRSAG